MVFKTLLIILVIAILMEDGSSMRKSEEERKEDEDLAKLVNMTLAEEAEKKRKEDEEKKDRTKIKKLEKEEREEKKKEEGGPKRDDQDEAEPSLNCTCPSFKPCLAPVDCDPCAPCGPCPEVKECPEEQPCRPCRPCGPCPSCPVENSTVPGLPPTSACPAVPEMSLPTAVAVGVAAGILLTGVATTIGILLRYLSPIESGFIFLATSIIVWYLCSHHPETARELGGRAVTILREASVALGHRVMAALQRHPEQVGFPVVVSFFLLLI
jgi:hypothetical protein